MSESGQPGAATPGEHGDGTGQQDDLARSAGGWAPPAAGWSRGGEAGREPTPTWRQPEPTGGWGASSTRHGDLPAPLAGPPAEAPPARVNGRPHVNGVRYAEEEPPVSRQAPVSAPPVSRQAPVSAPPAAEPRRDLDGDRLVVPAQRPAPPAEQPSAEAEPGPARHASDDPPTGRGSRRAEGTVPSSAPPAVQVPPVGTAAAGFEVPPGFHAPIVERGAPEPAPSLSRGWADRPAPPAAGPADHPAAPAEEPGWRAEPAERRAGPAEEPAWRAEPAERRAGPAEEPAWRAEPADQRAAPTDEPAWSGPSWNQPSWGSGWAPQWARDDEPGGRRARDERAAEWAPEPTRPYEPAGAEPARAYEPTRAEPARPYEAPRAEPARPYEAPRAEPYEVARTDVEPRPTYERENADRPSWAGGAPAATPFSSPPHTAPTSAPPVSWAAPASAPPYPAPTSVAPTPREAPGATPAYAGPPAGSDPALPTAARPAEERIVRPFRLRPEAEDVAAAPPAGTGGQPPPPATPGPATATSGTARFDRAPAPAPTSAPPYAARRSAPEPMPTAEPVADTRPDDRATAILPQRVPAEPDVPVVPEPPAVEPPAETPELARIATHLRRDDEPAPLRERPEGFDVNAILDAVREVAGVRDAALRRTPAGAHSLRLDLADGADPAEVSRQVARLLQDRMGLAAAPQNLPGMPATPPPPVRRRSERRAAETRPAEERAGASRTGPAPADPRATDSRDPRAPESRPGQEPEGRAGRLAEASDPESRNEARAEPETPRRRRPAAPHRGRATVEETSLAAAPAGAATGSPATLGTSYSGGQMTTTETAPSRPLDTGGAPGPRVVIDHVQVSTFGLDATVEVRLIAADATAEGHSTGPAVDGYVLRLCAVAAAAAVDELLRGAVQPGDRGRCFVEHTAVVPFGNCEVATVVVLLVCDGWVEQLAGSALVAGDPRQAVVRATLAAVNRRLEALLA